MAESQARKLPSLVIVGASRGIGAALAREAASRGFQKIHLVARRIAPLDSIKREIKRSAPEIEIIAHGADLSAEKDLMNFMHRLQEESEFPRAWIFCVGGSPTGKLVREPFESSPWSHLRQIVELNFLIPMQLCHQVVPELMRPNADGKVEAAKLVALVPQSRASKAGLSAYAASKKALEALFGALSEESGDITFQVVEVAPTETDLFPSGPDVPPGRSPAKTAQDILQSLIC